jgi:hypothetical protein
MAVMLAVQNTRRLKKPRRAIGSSGYALSGQLGAATSSHQHPFQCISDGYRLADKCDYLALHMVSTVALCVVSCNRHETRLSLKLAAQNRFIGLENSRNSDTAISPHPTFTESSVFSGAWKVPIMSATSDLPATDPNAVSCSAWPKSRGWGRSWRCS